MNLPATEFLTKLADHGAFLLFVLPVVGAALVLASIPLGVEVARRTAVTNVLLSLGVALLMLWRFELQPDHDRRFQMASSANFEPGASRAKDDRGDDEPRRTGVRIAAGDSADAASPLLRIAVGVDGVNLWLMLLVPAALLPAVVSGGRTRRPIETPAILLLLQAALIGAFAALDAVFFVCCLEAAGLLLFVLVGRSAGVAGRRSVAAFGVEQIAGSLLLLFGLSAAVLLRQWVNGDETGRLSFSLVRLVSDLPPAGDVDSGEPQFWRSWEPLLFVSLVAGLVLKCGLLPLHGRFGLCSRPGFPPAAAVVVDAVLPCLGVYGYLRLVAPLCPASAARFAPLLAGLSIAGALFCALLAWNEADRGRRLEYAALAHNGVAFACAASLTIEGLTAAVLLLIVHAAGFALLFTATESPATPLAPAAERRTATGLQFAGAFAVAGLPGLVGFPALWLSVRGFTGWGGVPAGGSIVLVHLLLAAALLNRRGRTPGGAELDDAGSSAAGTSVAGSLPALIVLIAFGAAPQFVVDRSSPDLQRIADDARDAAGRNVALREAGRGE